MGRGEDELAPGEEPRLLVRARIPRATSGVLTFPPLHLVVGAFDALRNRRHVQDVRRATAGVGVPLDRSMRMLVTNRRLLVWRTRRGQAPELLGSVARADILAARVPFVGGAAWRFVELRLRAGHLVRFQVEGTQVERFVQHLNA